MSLLSLPVAMRVVALVTLRKKQGRDVREDDASTTVDLQTGSCWQQSRRCPVGPARIPPSCTIARADRAPGTGVDLYVIPVHSRAVVGIRQSDDFFVEVSCPGPRSPRATFCVCHMF